MQTSIISTRKKATLKIVPFYFGGWLGREDTSNFFCFVCWFLGTLFRTSVISLAELKSQWNGKAKKDVQGKKNKKQDCV